MFTCFASSMPPAVVCWILLFCLSYPFTCFLLVKYFCVYWFLQGIRTDSVSFMDYHYSFSSSQSVFRWVLNMLLFLQHLCFTMRFLLEKRSCLWGEPSAQYHFHFSSLRCLCFEERLSASLLLIVPFWRLWIWDGYYLSVVVIKGGLCL